MIPAALVLVALALLELRRSHRHTDASLSGLGLTGRVQLQAARTCQRGALGLVVLAGVLVVVDLLGVP